MTETQVAAATDGDPTHGDPSRTRSYAWPDPAVDPERLAAMTGMEMFAAMNRGELPTPPIMATLGVRSVEATAEGHVTVLMEAAEYHYNPLGSMHGGVISTLLDTAAACAVHSTLPAGMAYTSLDLNVRFLKPVTVASGLLRAEGVVLSRGRTTALGEGRLFDQAGRLVAHATSTCLIFPAKTLP
jgi:uncharacterized protein (TIGR00369 family)